MIVHVIGNAGTGNTMLMAKVAAEGYKIIKMISLSGLRISSNSHRTMFCPVATKCSKPRRWKSRPIRN